MVSYFSSNKSKFSDDRADNDLLFIGNISFDKITNASGISKCVIGGGSFNSAYCASLVSNLKIKICSVVGSDFPLHIIKDRGINITGIDIVEKQSNTFIINEKTGDIFFENDKLLKFNLNDEKHVRHVHISCRKGISFPHLCLKNIKHSSSSIDVISSSLRDKIDEIKECLASTDILFLNNYEYEILNKYLRYKVEHAFPKVIIFVTQGKIGVLVKKYKNEMSFPGINVKRNFVSAIGAGDAFIGGFLGTYYSSRPFSEALAMGVSIATLSVQDFGVSHVIDKLPLLDEYFNKLMPIYKVKENKLYNILQ